MKEKYFKEGDILNLKIGSGPLHIRRSICGFGFLIKEGMKWRVGNGKKIRIWGDRCLPTPSTHMIQSSIKILQKAACIKEFIDENGC